MNEKKVAALKSFYLTKELNLSFINFLFLLDLIHFQETGRRVTKLHFLVINKCLVILNSPLIDTEFDSNLFTKRELKIINKVSSEGNCSVPALPEGEVNFLTLLNEATISLEVAQSVQADEAEAKNFASYLI
jgi:hypothetical protein